MQRSAEWRTALVGSMRNDSLRGKPGERIAYAGSRVNVSFVMWQR